jgi:tetratricopeptide (TPR) repeat protein
VKKIETIIMSLLLMVCLGIGSGSAIAEETSYRDDEMQTPKDVGFSKGVQQVIANTYLEHSAEYPDVNEPAALLQSYLEGRRQLRLGNTDAAIKIFRAAVKEFPDRRHAYAGLALGLWQQYEGTREMNVLRASVKAYLRAADIGMRYGRVLYTGYIGPGLTALKDKKRLDDFFQRALSVDDNRYLTLLDYARALATLSDTRAEEWYLKAINEQPAGNMDATTYYAEWLLDTGKEAEVIVFIGTDPPIDYLHFLRAVALERLGHTRDVGKEYDAYRRFNANFPAPAKYRIPGSRSQTGLIFEGDVPSSMSQVNALTALSRVISGEARGESSGGQRAVGWTVRTRVFRAYDVSTACGGYGSPTNGVWGAPSPGASLQTKYNAICNASGQFVQYTPTPSTNSRADEVYFGAVPDPVVCNCKFGYIMGSCCYGGCSGESTQGAFPNGPAWFHNDAGGSAPSYHPSSTCSEYKQETCSNGGVDNWFYKIRQ